MWREGVSGVVDVVVDGVVDGVVGGCVDVGVSGVADWVVNGCADGCVDVGVSGGVKGCEEDLPIKTETLIKVQLTAMQKRPAFKLPTLQPPTFQLFHITHQHPPTHQLPQLHEVPIPPATSSRRLPTLQPPTLRISLNLPFRNH